MPPQPQKRSNKTLWIVLGVVGGVLVLACVLCAGGVIFLGSQLANSPLIGSSLVIGQFCSYEERQDYPQAYGLFSSNLQNQMTQDQFAQAGQSHDDSSGTVSYCQTSASSQGSAPQVSDTSASFPVTITRGGGSGSVGNTVAIGTTASGTITLVKESGAWKIDSIDPSLALT